MSGRVIYSKEMRAEGIARNQPLVTIDIDARHVTGMRDAVRMTIQGAMGGERLKAARRALLEQCGVLSPEIAALLEADDANKSGMGEAATSG